MIALTCAFISTLLMCAACSGVAKSMDSQNAAELCMKVLDTTKESFKTRLMYATERAEVAEEEVKRYRELADKLQVDLASLQASVNSQIRTYKDNIDNLNGALRKCNNNFAKFVEEMGEADASFSRQPSKEESASSDFSGKTLHGCTFSGLLKESLVDAANTVENVAKNVATNSKAFAESVYITGLLYMKYGQEKLNTYF